MSIINTEEVWLIPTGLFTADVLTTKVSFHQHLIGTQDLQTASLISEVWEFDLLAFGGVPPRGTQLLWTEARISDS